MRVPPAPGGGAVGQSFLTDRNVWAGPIFPDCESGCSRFLEISVGVFGCKGRALTAPHRHLPLAAAAASYCPCHAEECGCESCTSLAFAEVQPRCLERIEDYCDFAAGGDPACASWEIRAYLLAHISADYVGTTVDIFEGPEYPLRIVGTFGQ
eukprot:4285110-Pyramimonas_sp.AAC.1